MTDEATTTVNIQRDQDLDLLYWLKQNKKNIENLTGGQLTAFSLVFTEADGYSVTYTKKTVTPVTPTP